MEMPKPTAGHRKLESFAGIWKGKETMHPSPFDPKGGVAVGTTHARIALGGFAIVGDYEQVRDGKKSYEGHAVYTWDPNANDVVLHWFDCMGMGVDEFRGAWKDATIQFQCENAMGLWRLSYDLSKPGKLASRMESSQDGTKWATLFDAAYERAD